jgi:hypothetical protein
MMFGFLRKHINRLKKGTAMNGEPVYLDIANPKNGIVVIGTKPSLVSGRNVALIKTSTSQIYGIGKVVVSNQGKAYIKIQPIYMQNSNKRDNTITLCPKKRGNTPRKVILPKTRHFLLSKEQLIDSGNSNQLGSSMNDLRLFAID